MEIEQGSREMSCRAWCETSLCCALQCARGGFKKGAEGALPPLAWPYDSEWCTSCPRALPPPITFVVSAARLRWKLIFSQASGFLVATIICRFLAVTIIYKPSVPDLDHSREVDMKCNVSALALPWVGQFWFSCLRVFGHFLEWHLFRHASSSFSLRWYF